MEQSAPEFVVAADGDRQAILQSRPRYWHALITFPGHQQGIERHEWETISEALRPGAHIAVVAAFDAYPLIAHALESAGLLVRDSIGVVTSSAYTDTRFVLLARSPLNVPVARAVLEHATGAINIDACRVPVPSNSDADDLGDGDSAAGRWPSNLVLMHHDSCRPAGTRKIRGITGTAQGRMAGRPSSVYGTYAGAERAGERTGFAAPDGTELVEQWNCHPGCSVRLLDEQAGTRKSGTPGTMRLGENRSAAYGAESRPAGTPMTGYGDSGAASRFFPKVHDPTALSTWLHDLLVPPGGTVLDPWAENAPCVPPCPGTLIVPTSDDRAALAGRMPSAPPVPDLDAVDGPTTDPTLFEVIV